jgi:hypothetical protein
MPYMGNTLRGGNKQASSAANPQVSPRMSLNQQIIGPRAQGIARKLGLAFGGNPRDQDRRQR